MTTVISFVSDTQTHGYSIKWALDPSASSGKRERAKDMQLLIEQNNDDREAMMMSFARHTNYCHFPVERKRCPIGRLAPTWHTNSVT